MENKVIALMAKTLEVDPSVIEMDMSVGDLPEWDSLHHLIILKVLEEEFNIKFAPEDLAELEDVSDLISLIKEMTC